MKKDGKKKNKTRRDTRIASAGLDPHGNGGIVNPPVYHTSTVLFPTVKDLKRAVDDPFNNIYYGRFGTPTSLAFEEAVAEIEGGEQNGSVDIHSIRGRSSRSASTVERIRRSSRKRSDIRRCR